MLKLIEVKAPEQIEWLRVQRNRPELYKYFVQDHEIGPEEHRRWWGGTPAHRRKLFIVHDVNKPVGYVGFDPLNRFCHSAKFGIFILPEFQGKGYGKESLMLLLRKGFIDYGLSNIESEVLDIPGENRFEFYRGMGFELFPPEHQFRTCKKNGQGIKLLKFFITKDVWSTRRAGGGYWNKLKTMVGVQ